LPFGLVFIKFYLDLAITPLDLTMVRTHLCLRYAWTSCSIVTRFGYQ